MGSLLTKSIWNKFDDKIFEIPDGKDSIIQSEVTDNLSRLMNDILKNLREREFGKWSSYVTIYIEDWKAYDTIQTYLRSRRYGDYVQLSSRETACRVQ